MKVLIWILTFLIGSILNTLLGYAISIRAGAFLLYIVEFYVAKKLCEKWDERKAQKQSDNNNQQSFVVPEDPVTTETMDAVSETNERKIQFCRRCGTKLIEGSEFCSNCGTPIEKEGAQ